MAISECDRELLRKNHVALVGHLHIDEEFLSHLLEDEIINDQKKEEIEVEKTMSDKVRHLLVMTLPRCGASALEKFIKAMVFTHQESLADMLDPTVAKKYMKQLAETQQTQPAEPRDVTRLKDAMQSDEVYRVSGARRGRAIIISNECFSVKGLSERTGNDVDVENLKMLLDYLQFDVAECLDKTDQEVYSYLKEESQNEYHKTADMFILFLLSHGVDGHVYASNGRKMSIEKITSYFDGVVCPALVGKPKMFFIQACQKVKPTTDSIDQGDGSSPTAVENLMDAAKKADMLIARSTVTGYPSKRSEIYGSRYIRWLVHVFQKHASKKDVVEMLTKLTNMLLNLGLDYTQLCEKRDTLTKKVYFMPGYVGQS
jgi:hypothetical protein